MTNQTYQQTVEEAVVTAVATQLGCTADEVDLDVPMLALPGMESINLLRAVARIEELLGVIVADDALTEVVTTRDLIKYLSGLITG